VTEKRKQTIQQAEEHAKDALNSLKRMYNLIDEPVLEAAAHVKTAARRNVRKIMDDVDEAKKKYTEELQNSNVAERYWKQVQTARENFNEELQILFPNINIYDKKLSVSEEAFDLFVLHMYHKVNNLQKELEKLRVSYYLFDVNFVISKYCACAYVFIIFPKRFHIKTTKFLHKIALII